MPRISHFHGIEIYMYFRDHAPPHFHAIHGDEEALVEWSPAQVHRGSLPSKSLKLALEWARLHPEELDENWQRAQLGQPLAPIPPLP
ncbi:MAG: DUF4160 domain-containing protein [Planctomycetaceae bacterium]|nr:DUF4160 domain-containing protein [Planctomycetaceae bacterium]